MTKLRGYAAVLKAKITRVMRHASRKSVVCSNNKKATKPHPGDYLKITCKIDGANICSQLNQVLPWLAFAEKKGLIPVVETISNSEMTWDDLFAQNKLLDDTRNCWYPQYAVSISQNHTVLKNKAEIRYWQKITRKYLQLTPAAKQYCQLRYETLNGIPTVGCLCRGSDYVAMKPSAHPVQPTPESCIQKVEEKMKKYNYKQVFLATEDALIYEKFAAHFGAALVTVDTEYVAYDAQTSAWINDYALNHGKKKIMDYFANVYILSKCDVMVAGVTSGSVAALMLSEEKRESYFFELGRYR